MNLDLRVDQSQWTVQDYLDALTELAEGPDEAAAQMAIEARNVLLSVIKMCDELIGG